MKKISFLPKHFEEIAQYLQKGGVTILPTDTIPGFSADPENKDAVHRISVFKNRPLDNPFLLLVPDFLTAERLCHFSKPARKLVNAFWPGPLTLLLKRKKGVLPDFFPGHKELAIRIPGNKDVRKFLNIFGRPLVSTSVNYSGLPPLIGADEIELAFHTKDLLLSIPHESKGHRSESTIVRVEDEIVSVLREGVISKHKIEKGQ